MSRILSAITFVVLALGTCVPGVSAQAYKKAQKSIETMRKTRSEIESAKAQKDKTMVALEQLTSQSGGNLQKAYKKFNDELNKLDKSAQKVRKMATDMRAKSQDYFKAWESELSNVQNPGLQQKAGERRAEAMKQFEELGPVFQAARESFVSLMASLQDIRNYLALDLSPDGVRAVADMAKEAQAQNKAVDEGIAKVMQEMNDFAAKFSTSGS